jgi:hypothetical protein
MLFNLICFNPENKTGNIFNQGMIFYLLLKPSTAGATG